jgi:hypothetical protein
MAFIMKGSLPHEATKTALDVHALSTRSSSALGTKRLNGFQSHVRHSRKAAKQNFIKEMDRVVACGIGAFFEPYFKKKCVVAGLEIDILLPSNVSQYNSPIGMSYLEFEDMIQGHQAEAATNLKGDGSEPGRKEDPVRARKVKFHEAAVRLRTLCIYAELVKAAVDARRHETLQAVGLQSEFILTLTVIRGHWPTIQPELMLQMGRHGHRIEGYEGCEPLDLAWLACAAVGNYDERSIQPYLDDAEAYRVFVRGAHSHSP